MAPASGTSEAEALMKVIMFYSEQTIFKAADETHKSV